MSNNLRQHLIEAWTYPPLGESLKGIHEYIGAGQYAGRVSAVDRTLSTLTLEWSGYKGDFSFQEAVFLPPQYGECISKGDLVAIEVAKSSVVTQLSLLTPSRDLQDFEGLKSRDFFNFLKLLREFFGSQNFTEILSPSLVICPGTEPYLKPFSVQVQSQGKIATRYLPTSPEISLKKYLSKGYHKIFEMKECFRNDEMTDVHRPEFLMLEWYRAFSNLDSIVEDIRNLLQFLSEKLNRNIDPLKVTTMAQLFSEYLSYELKPDTSQAQLLSLCRDLQLPANKTDTWDELFFRIFIDKIETKLPPQPILIRDYPPKLAAYARLNSSGWADRFELYWRGLEIANAFHELNDPNIQKLRMEQDNQRKLQIGNEVVPLDEDFLKSLQFGLPPSGGIALGVERLFMAFYEISNIANV